MPIPKMECCLQKQSCPMIFLNSYSEHVFHRVALYCEVNTCLLLPWMIGTPQHGAPFKWATLPELKAVLARRECYFYISSEVPFSNRVLFLFPILCFRQYYIGLLALTIILRTQELDPGQARGKAKLLTIPLKQTIMYVILISKLLVLA